MTSSSGTTNLSADGTLEPLAEFVHKVKTAPLLTKAGNAYDTIGFDVQPVPWERTGEFLQSYALDCYPSLPLAKLLIEVAHKGHNRTPREVRFLSRIWKSLWGHNPDVVFMNRLTKTIIDAVYECHWEWPIRYRETGGITSLFSDIFIALAIIRILKLDPESFDPYPGDHLIDKLRQLVFSGYMPLDMAVEREKPTQILVH